MSKFFDNIEKTRKNIDKSELLARVLYIGFKRKAKRLDKEPDYTKKEILSEIKSLQMGGPCKERVKKAAHLLAEASEGYLPPGPRGKRPILISSRRIGYLIGRNRTDNCHVYRAYGSISDLLIEEKLTASNPYSHNIKFTAEDLKRGIFIPEKIDEETVYALGFLASYGNLNAVNKKQKKDIDSIVLRFPENTDIKFIMETAKSFENAFNIPMPEMPKKYDVDARKPEFQQKTKIFRQHHFYRIQYKSFAIRDYLIETGFPIDRNEIKTYHLPKSIMTSEVPHKKLFLSSYTKQDANDDKINISESSINKLDDLRKLLKEINPKITSSRPIRSNKNADSWRITIGKTSAKILQHELERFADA